MIEIIDILKPKNGGSFKLIDAIDVAIEGYASLADCVSHMATTAMIEAINAALSGKQDKLTTEQLTAVNSGITSELVAQIGTNTTAIAGKASQSDLDALSATVATKADDSDLTSATASLQAQIDALVTPVTQDAEVENARVDAEGVSHATLKARIDSTETDLKGKISNISPCLYDKIASEVDWLATHCVLGDVSGNTTAVEKKIYFDKTKITPGYYLSNGVPTVNADYAYSDYFYIENLPYGFNRGGTNAIFFYDELFNLIDNTARQVQNCGAVANRPNGSVYCRFNLSYPVSSELSFYTIKTENMPSEISMEQVANLEDALESKITAYKTETVSGWSNNLFNPATATIGKFLNGTGATEKENELYSYSDYVEVDNLEYRYWSGMGTSACYPYTSEKVLNNSGALYTVAALSDPQNRPEGTKYIRFNFQTAHLEDVFVNTYSTKKVSYISPKQIYPQSIDIEVGTGKTYTTLKAAIAAAETLLSEYSEVNLLLAGETFTAFTAADLAAAPSNYSGLVLPDHCNLIGAGKDVTIIQGYLPTDLSGYSFDRNNVSTINLYKNHVVKDLTVTGQNMRYACHNDDFKSRSVPDAKEVFERVKFVYYANEQDVHGTSCHPIGIGAYNGRKTDFIDCDFIRYGDYGRTFLVHNNVGSPKPCEWTLKHCTFTDEDNGIVMGVSSAGSGQQDTIVLEGCTFNSGGVMRIFPQSVYQGTTSEFLVYGFGNYGLTGVDWETLTQDNSLIRI